MVPLAPPPQVGRFLFTTQQCYTLYMSVETLLTESSWKCVLREEFEKPYFKELSTFVENEYKTHTVYPFQKDIFRAFEFTPFDNIKVVILGQDPYHGPKQANGLAFAVPKDTILPPSLKNIFKEIQSDVHITPEQNGDLTRWATQGVLLLNSTLTVLENTPRSHQQKGWEQFTDMQLSKKFQMKKSMLCLFYGENMHNKKDFI
jgi:uracil-DNA glycosylase